MADIVTGVKNTHLYSAQFQMALYDLQYSNCWTDFRWVYILSVSLLTTAKPVSSVVLFCFFAKIFFIFIKQQKKRINSSIWQPILNLVVAAFSDYVGALCKVLCHLPTSKISWEVGRRSQVAPVVFFAWGAPSGMENSYFIVSTHLQNEPSLSSTHSLYLPISLTLLVWDTVSVPLPTS